MVDFQALATPFPADAVHWRAQSVAASGASALALAYIDARDVMDRLDAVCGPGGWRDSYTETARGRVIGTIEIFDGERWVAKSDGAGDTDVEGEKGGMSDAFKRTAVKWGIGRYLYRLPATWADCETYDRNGKKQWKCWTQAGLAKLQRVAGSTPSPDPEPVIFITDEQRDLIATLTDAAGMTLQFICESYGIASLKELPAAKFAALQRRLQNAAADRKPEQKEAA